MRVTFNSDAYQRSHGKAPRGEGMWGFGIETAAPEVEETLWSPNLSLTAAKAWARTEMASRPDRKGAHLTLHVLP
ncbi:MAG: hypothetical protein V4720_06280 [Pseudomonadota bacterium]